MERDEEIAAIERELALLRARYAVYRRSAAIMRAMFMVLIPLAAIAAAAFAVWLLLFDVLYGAFFLGAVPIFAAAVVWFVRSLDLRWIDFVSQSPRSIYNPYFFTPDVAPSQRAKSDAELIEWQIAARERRLAELGARSPGSDPIH